MADQQVLLIGDETASGLKEWLPTIIRAQNLPVNLWVESKRGSGPAEWMDPLADLLGRMAARSEPPQVILISLGKRDLLDTADRDVEGFGRVRLDEKALQDKIRDLTKLVAVAKASGARVKWILPPALPDEGLLRQLMQARLGQLGVHAFPGEKKRYAREPDGDVAPKGYSRWAEDVARSVPLGGFRGTIGPRRAEAEPEAEADAEEARREAEAEADESRAEAEQARAEAEQAQKEQARATRLSKLGLAVVVLAGLAYGARALSRR